MPSLRVVAIVGMHRSGTSLAANAARRLGVETGQELLEANDFNQEGYWEDAYIVRQHEQLLASLGRPWGAGRGTLPLPRDWKETEGFETARRDLTKYLLSEFSRLTNPTWMVKDPRISIVLPLWQRLASELDFQFVPILCVRGPNAVAASLQKRDRIHPDIGRLLWLQYYAAIVSNMGDGVRAVLNYDRWFDEQSRNFSLLANALDCAVPISADLVKHDLRHHPATDSDGILGLWQGRLDKWALDQNMPPELKAEAQRVNEFGELFEKWREAVLDQSAATEVIESMRRERDSLVATANQNLEAYRAEAREPVGYHADT